MFTSIKTSAANKEIVTRLTRKLNLGTENIIARIALSYSLEQEQQLDLKDLQDAKGKEYPKNVLFGDQLEIYAGMVAVKYNIPLTDRNLPKYIKLHIDEGLYLLNTSFEKSNSNSFDFLKSKIQMELF